MRGPGFPRPANHWSNAPRSALARRGRARAARPSEPSVEAAERPAPRVFGLMEVVGEAAHRLRHAVDAAAEQDVNLVVVDTRPAVGQAAKFRAGVRRGSSRWRRCGLSR